MGLILCYGLNLCPSSKTQHSHHLFQEVFPDPLSQFTLFFFLSQCPKY